MSPSLKAKQPQYSPPFNPITDDWKQRPDAYAKWAVKSFNDLHKDWSKQRVELEHIKSKCDNYLASLKQISLNCHTIEEATQTARNAIGKDEQ